MITLRTICSQLPAQLGRNTPTLILADLKSDEKIQIPYFFKHITFVNVFWYIHFTPRITLAYFISLDVPVGMNLATFTSLEIHCTEVWIFCEYSIGYACSLRIFVVFSNIIFNSNFVQKLRNRRVYPGEFRTHYTKPAL